VEASVWVPTLRPGICFLDYLVCLFIAYFIVLFIAAYIYCVWIASWLIDLIASRNFARLVFVEITEKGFLGYNCGSKLG